MNSRSTYEYFGIPESLAISIALVSLALTLAPWVEGAEVGPLKVPKIRAEVLKSLKIIAPIFLLLTLLGFPKLWHEEGLINKNEILHQDINQKTDIKNPSYETYLNNFFDTNSNYIKGEAYPLKEIESEYFETYFSYTCWQGGRNWGDITFSKPGRIGQYSNLNGRSPGKIILQGTPNGTVPIIIGEWIQLDGQKGKLFINLPEHGNVESLEMSWGPNFSVKNLLRKKTCPPSIFYGDNKSQKSMR
ncbi:TPA: hypothetical protein NPP25_003613 [Klebsiella quasipneumoniae subsp. similipneumoniae]|nr:hypothetical protein [Klebsiella quasipneumoniae subsp. similipneumoniae]HCI6654122.1 hypothetical protein [Klebsiella quasipneumoniae subsp. similipneumoniae]